MKYARLNNYKESKLFSTIYKILTKRVGIKCSLFYVSSPGSSNSKVYLFKAKDKKMYAIKVIDKTISRVSLYKESENKRVLEQYIPSHLPNVIYIGIYKRMEIMISQCFGMDNFYSSLINNKKPIIYYEQIWASFLNSIIGMWITSKNYDYDAQKNPRNNLKRINRIKKGICYTSYNDILLNDIMDKEIIINNQKFPSINQLFIEISRISDPPFGITCHGDPQPTNIIISEGHDEWYMVDWEWSGSNHDYRQMFSHLYGWWATRMINTESTPDFYLEDDKLIINYKILDSKLIENFQKLCKVNFLNKFKIRKNDIDDINRFLSLLYLGDVRFLDIWGRKDYLPVLIGEACKTIYSNNKNSFFAFKLEI